MPLLNKIKNLFNTKIGRLSLITLISSLAFAFNDVVWALYLDRFLQGTARVGFFSALLTIISFFSYFLLVPYIERNGKTKTYLRSLIFFVFIYALFSINTNFYVFVILAFGAAIAETLRVTSRGVIVKDNSHKKSLSKNQGIHLTFENLAWLIGPVIAGIVAAKYGINLVYLLSALFLLLSVITFKLSEIKNMEVKEKTNVNMVKNFFNFFKDKDRIIAYIFGGVVGLWSSLIYIYMPLYIVRSGLGLEWIGYLAAAVTIHLVLFEYFFGKLAGKIGFKNIFRLGFLTIALFCMLSFLLTDIYLILLALSFTGIGIAMLEPTTEAYFFDILDKKESLSFYGPYNTTSVVNKFIGRFSSAIVLLFLPFKFIFILFAIFMFILFTITFKMRDVIEDEK